MISAVNEDITWYKPRLRAPAVGAQVGKVLRHPQDILDTIVLLASHRQALVKIPKPLYHIEELGPDFFPAPRLEERLAIANDDEARTSAREKHV